MSGKARKVLGIVGVCVGVLTIGGWIVLHPKTHDPYRFLDGRPVADVAVQGPGSWPATEYRTYTWKQNWKEVAAQARLELPKFGLKERSRRTKDLDGASWSGELIDGGLCGVNSDISVFISPGRSLPLREKNELTDNDPEWVTVLVSNFLDESWITVLRYTFFRMGE